MSLPAQPRSIARRVLPVVACILPFACDAPPSQRPSTPQDDIVLVAGSAIDSSVAQVIGAELSAPVQFLGRWETPFRLLRRATLTPEQQRSILTLVRLETQSAWRAGASPSATASATAMRPQVGDSLLTPSGTVRWSTEENVDVAQQTLVRAWLPARLDTASARLLGGRLRGEIESCLLRHEVRRLRDEAGASALPRRATQGAFELLLPAGYAWSDTSSGWPNSLQMFRAHPTRVVTVFWLDDAAPEWIDSREFLLGFLRDAMWRLQRDRLAQEDLEWSREAAPGPAVRGIWQNPREIAGGPLQTRFVYDRARHRLYGVQALVFVPGADKTLALREALAIASTFEILE